MARLLDWLAADYLPGWAVFFVFVVLLWLADWLACLLTGWLLAGCLVGLFFFVSCFVLICLADWFAACFLFVWFGWLICRLLAGCLVAGSLFCLMVWLADWLAAGWLLAGCLGLADWPAGWLTGWLLAGCLVGLFLCFVLLFWFGWLIVLLPGCFFVFLFSGLVG